MQRNNYKDNKVIIDLETCPQFGTLIEKEETKYFTPLKPTVKQKKEILNSFIMVEYNYNRKETFYIYMNSSADSSTIKLEIKLANILKVEVQKIRRNLYTLYFRLDYPPKVFRKISQKLKVKTEDHYIKDYHRVLDSFSFTNHYHVEYLKDVRGKSEKRGEIIYHDHSADPNLPEEETQNEDILFDAQESSDFLNFVRLDSYFSVKPEFLNFYLLNLWMKLRINFNSEEEAHQFITELKLKGVSSSYKEIFPLENENQLSEVDNLIRDKRKLFYSSFLKLHFNLQYALLSLITSKRLNVFSLNMQLLTDLQAMDCERQDAAALVIERIIREYTKWNAYSDVLQIFNNFNEKSFENQMMQVDEKERNNKDTMKTRTILITPNMVIYKPPAYEKISHILRKYGLYRDNFIKVNFVEEDERKIFFSTKSMWVMINFLKHVMYDGIVIGSRTFQFLSASNSQMKNSSYWFFNLEGTRFDEIEQIMKEQGDFSKETNIHKNAARRGQCLSTTTFVKKIDPGFITVIDDIEKNGFCFTDGIGKISPELASQCARAIRMEGAAAFQIRMGGAKGMVAVDPKLSGEQIHIRPSMIKFESNDTELGVIRGSGFSMGFLNRQIIILLSTLGVPDKIFCSMASEEIQKFEEVIKDPHSLYHKGYNKHDLVKKCYFFMSTLQHFHNKGFSIQADPFLSTLVLNLCISKVIDIKKKGKIYDPYSAVLIGVIDETNSLEEGEVFIRIRREAHGKNEEYFCLDKNCIVTKNPCLHPGDIKVLKATNSCYNKLKHLDNVIVFSARGKRPVQNEIGGGDLDGDSFFVSWNEELINNLQMINAPPMDETKGSGQVKKHVEINRKGIIDSYIDYMKNDTIAFISNTHLAFADSDTKKGAYNEKCLKLAEMFCVAIDAPKHGNFVRFEDFQKFDLVLKKQPDFLENVAFSSYESPGVIGQLYRLIKEHKYLDEFERKIYKFNYLEDYLLEVKFVSNNSSKFALQAYDIYNSYQYEVRHMMKLARSFTETELFLSENLYDKQQNKLLKANDAYTELTNLREAYTNKILKTFAVNGEISYDVASAFYVVTYLNDKSLNHYYDFLMPRFKDLVEYMVKDGRLGSSDGSVKRNYKTYDDYQKIAENFKEYKKYSELINRKRIFSLPWLIKEIREKLLRLGKH